MKKIIMVLLMAAMLMALLPGCAGQTVLGQEIKSDKPRDTAPVVSETDMKTLVEGNNAFAFALLQVLREKEGNLFYSPYSISEALAMTYAGAKGDTEKSMADALNFLLSQDKLHSAFNNLDLLLKQRGQGAKGKDDEGFRLNIANAIWGQQGFNFLSSYLDMLAQNYGAGMRLVDYINETEKSRVTINDWVSDRTEGKIKDLIPQGSIDELTRLVLTNAIYFNAAWAFPFNADATKNGTFHALNGDVQVPMMHQTEDFNYIEGANYQAVELPYDGLELSMVILMPKAGQYESFEKSLDANSIGQIISGMKETSVIFTMPKFEYESSLGLKDALTKLGMGVAFTENADFSGIDGKHDLLIQDVLHKAFVSVDEEGTEAAAATAVIVGITSMPINQKVMTVDQPFIFLIRDIQTNSIVFLGRVLNPAI
jgi:serpin B